MGWMSDTEAVYNLLHSKLGSWKYNGEDPTVSRSNINAVLRIGSNLNRIQQISKVLANLQVYGVIGKKHDVELNRVVFWLLAPGQETTHPAPDPISDRLKEMAGPLSFWSFMARGFSEKEFSQALAKAEQEKVDPPPPQIQSDPEVKTKTEPVVVVPAEKPAETKFRIKSSVMKIPLVPAMAPEQAPSEDPSLKVNLPEENLEVWTSEIEAARPKISSSGSQQTRFRGVRRDIILRWMYARGGEFEVRSLVREFSILFKIKQFLVERDVTDLLLSKHLKPTRFFSSLKNEKEASHLMLWKEWEAKEAQTPKELGAESADVAATEVLALMSDAKIAEAFCNKLSAEEALNLASMLINRAKLTL